MPNHNILTKSYFLDIIIDAHLGGELDAFRYLEEKMTQVEELCELKLPEAANLYQILSQSYRDLSKALHCEYVRRESMKY